MQRRTFSTRALALGLTLLLAQPLALMGQSAQPQLPDPGTPSMNKQQQEQLGLQAIGEVYKQMPVLPDSSRETQYVQQLAKKLQAVIPADKNWPYQFHVIQASDINAFALPGGPIFVNVGTITAAEMKRSLRACWRTRCRTCTCSIQPSRRPRPRWRRLSPGWPARCCRRAALVTLAAWASRLARALC